MFSSVVGYLLYYYVLTHMEASRISAFSYAQPVMGTTLAALLLGEPLTFALLISGGLVLAGVYVTERSRWN
jgi:drug/metabolite transporter (DMT)-like permease